MRTYVGIDPGKKGALVLLNDMNDVAEKYIMPTIKSELDCHGLAVILNMISTLENCKVCLEEVHAIHGSAAGATFTFGGVFYACKMGLCAFNIPHTLVQPKEWQKIMHQGVPEIRKPNKRIKVGKFAGAIRKGNLDRKAMSEIAAKRLFPNVDLRMSERSRKSHDGIVDALLLAEYARRMYK